MCVCIYIYIVCVCVCVLGMCKQWFGGMRLWKFSLYFLYFPSFLG